MSNMKLSINKYDNMTTEKSFYLTTQMRLVADLIEDSTDIICRI